MAAEADAEAWLREALARALEANGRWERLSVELRAENGRLREENARLGGELARRDAQLEEMAAELAVLKRLVFGRSSERARPDDAGDDGGMRAAITRMAGAAGRAGRGRGRGGGTTRTCPASRWSGIRRAAGTAVRGAGGRSRGWAIMSSSSWTGSAATVTGACAQTGTLLVSLEEAIAARPRDSWHLHADETSWRVFCPREGDGPARWWLWVFIGPDTACFVMDPTLAAGVRPGTSASTRHRAAPPQPAGPLGGEGRQDSGRPAGAHTHGRRQCRQGPGREP